MESIIKYFPQLSPLQQEQFGKLYDLYSEWNDKINVISRRDITNLYLHHVLHSLSIAKFLSPVDGTHFLDMGTGGGFPGIPLAIMWPQCNFHLIDRIGKKIKVASDIASRIGLKNVSFQHGDIGECRQKYDFVLSRAVMRLDSLAPLVRKNISGESLNAIPNGLLCLKGGELGSEIAAVRRPVLEVPLETLIPEEYFADKYLLYVAL